MATVTGFTAARMLEIEAAAIVNGAVDLDGDLTLYTHGGTPIAAGNIKGPQGTAGNDVDARAYSDAQDVINLAAGKTYSDAQDVINLAAGKTYSDAQDVINLAAANATTALGSGVNLNTLTAPGAYAQSTSANATVVLNYPVAIAGLLEVSTAVGGGMVWQRYTTYNLAGVSGDRVFVRGWYNNYWSPWSELAKIDATGWTVVSAGTVSGVTLGNGTATFRYKEFGTYVIGAFELIVGSTTTFQGAIAPNLPVTPAAHYVQGYALGSATFFPASVASIEVGVCAINNSPGIFFPLAEVGYAGPTKPFTWASGNKLRANFCYEK